MEKAKSSAAFNIFRGYTFVSDVSDIIAGAFSSVLHDKDTTSKFIVDAMRTFPWLNLMITIPSSLMKRDNTGIPNCLPGTLYYLVFYAHISAARLHRYRIKLSTDKMSSFKEEDDPEEKRSRAKLTYQLKKVIRRYLPGAKKRSEILQLQDIYDWSNAHIEYFNFLCDRPGYVPVKGVKPEFFSIEILSRSTMLHFYEVYSPFALMTPELYSMFERHSKSNEQTQLIEDTSSTLKQ